MNKRAFLALVLLFCLLVPLLVPAQVVGGLGTLKIKCFKIGKADAYLLFTDQHAVLIDAGEDDDAPEISDYLKNRGIKQLDAFVITHFDKRSIGGAPELLGLIPANRILVPDYQKDNDLTNLLFSVLSDMAVERVTKTTAFTLDQVEFTVYPAAQGLSHLDDQDNGHSLVVSVRHGENSFFFSGDIQQERINDMAARGELSPHTMIKMPCHGQNIPGLATLLDAVKPRLAVIPCSAKNPPAGAVTADLEGRGVRFYATKDGAIMLTSDGFELTVKQTKKEKNNDE